MSTNSVHPHLRDYRADVERYFETKSESVITNRDRNHAAVLMSTIFKMAEKEVLLFSRKFEKDFYERQDIRDAVIRAAERGVRFKIMIQEDADESTLISELAQYPNISITRCDSKGDCAKAEFNFTVADDSSFRLESDRNTCAAYACANDKEIARKLKSIFEEFEINERALSSRNHPGNSPVDTARNDVLLSPP